mmetsp:Transcript_57695/g.163863  ORF Transcript_57695/g.163863 Transcript_57695/m.163863 type:complete len:212 (+) Transcript_57695:1674-2309(+)
MVRPRVLPHLPAGLQGQADAAGLREDAHAQGAALRGGRQVRLGARPGALLPAHEGRGGDLPAGRPGARSGEGDDGILPPRRPRHRGMGPRPARAGSRHRPELPRRHRHHPDTPGQRLGVRLVPRAGGQVADAADAASREQGEFEAVEEGTGGKANRRPRRQTPRGSVCLGCELLPRERVLVRSSLRLGRSSGGVLLDDPGAAEPAGQHALS